MSHPPRRTPLHPLVHLMVPTNLTVEVEGEIEVVEVKKHILRQFPDRVLGHLREDGVPKLVEAGRTASAKTNHRQHYETFSNSWWQASAKIDFWICKLGMGGFWSPVPTSGPERYVPVKGTERSEP